MIVTDIHNNEHQITSIEELVSVLMNSWEGDDAAFFLCHPGQTEEIWLSFHKEIAYPHYFRTTSGEHPGFQPHINNRSPESLDKPNVKFLQVGASQADAFDMVYYATLPIKKAIEVAVEFSSSPKMPKCIVWEEL